MRSQPIYRLRVLSLGLFWATLMCLGSYHGAAFVLADWKHSKAWNHALEDSAVLDLAAASALYPWDAHFRSAPAMLISHRLSLRLDVGPKDLITVQSVRATVPTSLMLMATQYRICDRLNDEECKNDVANRFLALIQHQKRNLR